MSTRPLVPGNNSQCSQPGIDNNVYFLHPDTGLSFCTGESPLPLKLYGRELQNVPVTHMGLVSRIIAVILF